MDRQKTDKKDVNFDNPRGGGKKRKKKNYTTPKKIKHKHKKVKLAVLKYYKVGRFLFIKGILLTSSRLNKHQLEYI